MKENFRSAVMAVIVNDENKILIGSSPRDGGYKFPQGGKNEGESFRECVIRELKEELGLDLNDEDILEEYLEKVRYYYLKIDSHTNQVGQEQTVFKIKYRKDMILIPQDNEFGELIWIDPKDLQNYDIRHRAPAYLKAIKLCKLI